MAFRRRDRDRSRFKILAHKLFFDGIMEAFERAKLINWKYPDESEKLQAEMLYQKNRIEILLGYEEDHFSKSSSPKFLAPGPGKPLKSYGPKFVDHEKYKKYKKG